MARGKWQAQFKFKIIMLNLNFISCQSQIWPRQLNKTCSKILAKSAREIQLAAAERRREKEKREEGQSEWNVRAFSANL